jgi:hypothetical protein
MYDLFIGIDPGVSGSIITLDADGDTYHATQMPEGERKILDYLNQYKGLNVCIVLERIWGRPSSGSTQMFTMGRNYGAVVTACCVDGYQLHETIPQQWQKYFHFNKKEINYKERTKWKNLLKERAMLLFPKQHITLKTADGFLIAHYCWQNYK